MGLTTEIGWTEATINLWWGCTKVHVGCDHCYAETLHNRFEGGLWGKDAPRRIIKSAFNNLNKLQRTGEKENRMVTVFVGSMMDIFEKDMRTVDSDGNVAGSGTAIERQTLFSLIQTGTYPNIRFLLLTKRPSNINKMIPEAWKENGAPDNVWFGTSPVDQKTFDTLVPQLAKVKGNRFLSIEPQLDFIDIYEQDRMPIGWIICGGESGAHRRPFNVDWARSLKAQCREAGIPFFMKQIDKVIPVPSDLENDKYFPW